MTVGHRLDPWMATVTGNQGGKFLILGPKDPDMKPEGYHVFRSPTVNVWCGMRGLDPDVAKARELCAKLRIYPDSQRDNPPDTKQIRPEGKKWTGEQRFFDPSGTKKILPMSAR